jgi:cob(I)alamin adenosyltransferase
MKERINRVTTRTGDAGETGLADGSRLPKSAPRMDAIGAVDELNAQLGLLRASLAPQDELAPHLADIQHRLFDLGGALSLPGTTRFAAGAIGDLEAATEALNGTLPPLTNFVLPAGDEAVARAHVARTVCRRAERDFVRLAQSEPGRDAATLGIYLNRLSDLLFVIGRVIARRGAGEVIWEPRPD